MMTTWKRYAAVVLSTALVSSLWVTTGEAKPGKGRNNTQPTTSQPTQVSPGQTTTIQQESTTFSAEQRSKLTNLLNGKEVRNDVLNATTRTQVNGQLSSLPPGIQKRLARGKGLPPGIAKKVFLPKTVNSYLNVPSQYDLIVMGSNVVMYDTAKAVVVDLITRFI